MPDPSQNELSFDADDLSPLATWTDADRSITVTLTAQIGTNVFQSASADFTVLLKNPCHDATLVTIGAPASLFATTPIEYTLFADSTTAPNSVTHNQFTVSLAIDPATDQALCGSLEYTAEFDFSTDGSSFDPIAAAPIPNPYDLNTQVAYDADSLSLKTYSEEMSNIGTHQARITAKLLNFPATTSTQATQDIFWIDPCIAPGPQTLDNTGSTYTS